MNKKLTSRYYLYILLSAAIVLFGAIMANVGEPIPYYVYTLAYGLLLLFFPLSLYLYNRKKKQFEAEEDKRIRIALYTVATNMKMAMMNIPVIFCAILYAVRPIESSLYATIAGLLLFVVLGKPEEIK